MDPVTILQTVGAAAEMAVIILRACNEIYKFTNEVKSIDRTMNRVEDEVSDLDRTMKMVAHGLNDKSVKRVARTRIGGDILSVVNTSVDRSKYCLERLDGILKTIIGDPTDSSPMRALRQTVRSKRQNRELNGCLEQIDRSKQSLNICLTTLSVHIVASLSARQEDSEESIAPLTKQLESALMTPKNAEDSRIRKTAASVLERAKSPPPADQRLSRATTLMAEEPADELGPAEGEESLDAGQEARWWKELFASNRESSMGSRRASVSKSLRSYPSIESDEPDFNATALVEPANERFQIDLTREAINEGNNNYKHSNYEQAAAQFEEALTTADPLSKQATVFLERELIQVRLNIASIYVIQNRSLESAERHLLQAVVSISADKRNKDDEIQQSLYNAYYLLARVYLLQYKYNEAQSYCEEVMNGHMATSADNEKAYLDTQQLLTTIYFSQNNNVRAQILLKKLPQERRDKVMKQMQERRANQSLSVPTSPPMPSASHKRTSSSTIPTPASSFMDRTTSVDTTRGTVRRTFSEQSDPPLERLTEAKVLEQAGFKDDFDADEALAWAIKSDNARMVQALVSHPGIPVTKKRHFGRPSLIHKLANINGSSKKSMRDSQPLILATKTPGRVMIAKQLLNLGANRFIRDEHNRSLLEVAALHGQQEIISVLIEDGVKVRSADGVKAYHLAAQNNRVNVLSLFLHNGMKIDEIDSEYDRTALNWAAMNGHEKAVEYLISNGADPNIADRRGSTALIASVRQGHEAMTRLLLRFFADVNQENDRGQTALIVACEQGRLWAVALLLDEISLDIDRKDLNGWTALMSACYYRQSEIAKRLLQDGHASVNATCKRGSRALDHARGNKVLQDLLKQYGAQSGTGIARRGTVDETYKGYVLI